MSLGAPGRDLRVPPGPGLPDGLGVPAAELVERFSRSSGPGGQSVNTTDSRVELEYDVSSSDALTPAQRARAADRLVARLVDGRLVVVASEHRSQHRNRVTARERLAELLRAALAPPPPVRRATRPTRGARERRLEGKRHRAETKALRRRVRWD
ncbi:alternative ribosome rescue aminoacyl-tRNA hydrolase ArfB [Nocardioides sp.]|uniref:alternative ribosome rescue aminoacyl-tRNA hydrolase ArfB n=1 Tax=Nocardioides sp. TaxID=35761 RepID=UPI0035293F28